MVYEHHH